jgi:hypothetical protein
MQCGREMKTILIIACLLALILVGCNGAAPERAEEPAFKGMELYSWKPGGKDWHFSLLVGTNRQKPISEITKPEDTIVGVEALKEKLSLLAREEKVFWSNMAEDPVPQKTVEDLIKFCEGLDIKLKGL